MSSSGTEASSEVATFELQVTIARITESQKFYINPKHLSIPAQEKAGGRRSDNNPGYYLGPILSTCDLKWTTE